MSPWLWVLIAIVVVLLGVVAWLALERRRSARLRAGFGPEYTRTVAAVGDRRRAEAELDARRERVEALQIRPLAPDDRERFAAAWHTAQSRFVDDPGGAIAEADRLVADVMEARGYPVGDFEQRAADISVDHPRVVEHYRAAHRIAEREARGEADTEELRRAMVDYRALFEELLGAGEREPKEVGR
jgi:hypothetical protein